jgi:UPF0716 protein FxsA
MLGGLLLMVPGLASDVVGLACLFPPTAALLRRAGERHLTRGGGPFATAFRHSRIQRPHGTVLRGEVVRDEDDDERGDGDERRDELR